MSSAAQQLEKKLKLRAQIAELKEKLNTTRRYEDVISDTDNLNKLEREISMLPSVDILEKLKKKEDKLKVDVNKVEVKKVEPLSRDTTHVCPVCGKTYINLNQHITKMHGNWKPGEQSEYQVEYELQKSATDVFISGTVKVNGKDVGNFTTEATSGNEMAEGFTPVNAELGGQFRVAYLNGKMILEKYTSGTSTKPQEIKNAKFIKN
tara:strand:- start:1475 stop:2095 length:621 start_codon:yes stop_codon:yes gene_type:complete